VYNDIVDRKVVDLQLPM